MIGNEPDYAESWEIVDHGDDQSIVIDGPHAGRSLGDLYHNDTRWLMGDAWTQAAAATDNFPLLFKFLDCHRVLSVQVHPNDEQGAKLDPPDLGKTEAWVVLHCEPHSVIYSGLKVGIDRATLESHIIAGTIEQALHSFSPQVGDCVFIPAGTVHALGGGLLVAEIQQSSNTTFRLFDWGRTDALGHPRPLHIDQSLDATDFERGPVNPIHHQVTSAVDSPVRTLVECEKFCLRRVTEGETKIGGDDRCHLVSVISGSSTLMHGETKTTLSLGETIVLPAATAQGRLCVDSGSEALWISPPR